jgi:S1-C subfamily serine protease
MRSVALVLALSVLAACGKPEDRPPRGAPSGIGVEDHFVEIPRIPVPAYHRDGARVTRVGGEPWGAAGVRAGDVVASVDGRKVYGAEDFWSAVGKSQPRQVVVRGSRLGIHGTRLLDLGLAR